MRNETMTFGEMIQAVRDGDSGCTLALLIETAIMVSPFAIVAGAYFYS